MDLETKYSLKVVAKTFEKEGTLSRLDLILQLSRKKKLNLGVNLFQDLQLVIKLRIKLIQFKSLLTLELEEKDFLKRLQKKDSSPPQNSPEAYQNFFLMSV